MSKSVVCCSILFLCCLSSFAVLPSDAKCYRYYAKYLDDKLNITVRSQQECHSEYCWRAHVSFPDGQLENDIVEGGCIDNCDILGENHCTYGDDIPDVKVRDSQVFGRISYSKPKAACCCKGDLCNSASEMKSTGLLALVVIALLGRFLLDH
uniref:UPAR/Ly6 domain-containing protein n=1 Tax=Plectus sambesii TaxID=2011161 RepID=A0A914VND0_9BILA